jgi:hypothetical protein
MASKEHVFTSWAGVVGWVDDKHVATKRSSNLDIYILDIRYLQKHQNMELHGVMNDAHEELFDLDSRDGKVEKKRRGLIRVCITHASFFFFHLSSVLSVYKK